MENKKLYDEKRILFVLREPQGRIQEISAYLRALRLPEGFTAEVTSNIEVPTAACYNAVQRESNARYKVYIAPGTVILEEDFLIEMVRLFEKQPEIGIIGLLGTEQLPTSGLFWDAPSKVGRALLRDGQRIEGKTVSGDCQDVMAVTDVIATQYDVPWREDLFCGEAFLAASACVEYRRQSYRTVVIASEEDSMLMPNKAQSALAEDQERFLDTYSRELYPLVSIIIPTYQRPEYFRIALTSAVQQTYRNLVIFITDDSDGNDTKEIYEQYFSQDTRIHYEHHPEYGGVENWKRVEEYNSLGGEYVSWLMDDDMILPEKIAKMMDCYFAYPDITLVTSYRQCMDADGNILPDIPATIPLSPNSVRIKGELMGRAILMNLCNFVGEPSTVLVRKKDLLDGHCFGWLEKKKYHGTDYETWLRLLARGDMIYLNEPLSRFRLHSGQDQRQASTNLQLLINWGLIIRTAIEQKLFLNDVDARLQAVSRCLAAYGNALEFFFRKKEILGTPVFRDFLKVYEGTVAGLRNNFRFSYQLDE